MASGPFLVVELERPDLVFARFTERFEGCTVDLISEPVVHAPDGPVHPTVFMVRGVPVPALAMLETALAERYGRARTLQREDLLWVARILIPERALVDPGAIALTQFQHRFGVPWVHLEGGVFHMRARVRAGVDPERLARQCRGYLAAQGVDAQVTVQEISDHDFGVWRDLVEHAVGLME